MRTALKAITLVAVLGLVACTSHGSSGTSSPTPDQGSHASQPLPPAEIGATTPNPNPGLVVSGARLGPSGQAIIGIGDADWLTTDAGTTWRAIDPTMNPAGGRSVDSRGSTVVAAVTESGQLTYAWSRDAGKTWTRQRLTPPQVMDTAGIALSADGSRVALIPPTVGSSGIQRPGVVFAGPVGQDLVGRDAPIDGSPAWVGTQLVLTGGPDSTQLFASGDQGRAWTQSTVAGVKAPSANVMAGAPNIGTPVSSADRSVVPVTIQTGTATSLSLLATTDGATFTSIGSVTLGGFAGPGVVSTGSDAGPDSLVFTDPTSTTLFWVRGSQVTPLETEGLPTPLAAITFSDPNHGLALASPSSCASDAYSTTAATDCMLAQSLYSTADGGHTWVAATGPSA
jgi:hypothetical protein